MTEVLCGAKFRFPATGRYILQRSRIFTKFNANGFDDTVAEKWLFSDSGGVEDVPGRVSGQGTAHACLRASTVLSCNPPNRVL